ncbi:MAG: tRNA (N(6)-L-threonylcarbamoyladenosine(37)-C(2))-methylthiotransferase MtaB [Oscillospiraceae bacterium]|nr:tRNA (N(6)-L-threonylcarbamoyladenosine(37)-C(2))-methylthiotransferase MtaB [Oscillospiraceae bacterium]
MRFAVTTLGCKANQYDTGIIATLLCENGYEQVRLGDGCDVCIINTCAVTAESVRKSKQAINKMKKLEPTALIAVCGCFSKLDDKAATQIGADLIGGTNDREQFATKVIELVGATALGRPRKQTTSPPPTARTRALLKIQDGCDNHCTYCIIPYARGVSRSMPLDEIANKAKKLQELGYKEIIITGIEISSWGKDLTLSVHLVTVPLVTAIQTISTAAADTRLRLGSLDPRALSPDFIDELTKVPNLCNHFHISLQSGCDETLKRMGRKYKTADVLQAVEELRKKFPNCGITADLIVGFPGETQGQYKQTLGFIKKAAFSDMHIFPYSKRPGTAAEKMPNQIEKSEKQKRTKEAIQIAEQMKNEFLQSQIGKIVPVLFEEQKDNLSIGHGDNYTKIAVENTVPNKIDKNVLKNVLISSIKDGILIGKIV